MKKNNRTKSLLILLLSVIILFVGLLFYMKYKDGNPDKNNDQVSKTTMEQSEETIENNYIEIATPYLTLKFPEENSELLIHEEEDLGDAVVEVFYMKTEGDDLPLYRIDFGDENAGDWLGIIKTDTEEIPVTYTVFSTTEEELKNLNLSLETYSALMNDFNSLLNSIYEDSRFSAEKDSDIGEEREIELTYWKLVLPENVKCSETMIDDTYQADFYIEIQGEQVMLYSVYIGEKQAETTLGQYKVDGSWKPISIESYDLSDSEWSEEELMTAYQMMDTINDVIETISQSDQFVDSIGTQNHS